jgi:hypothetical protein
VFLQNNTACRGSHLESATPEENQRVWSKVGEASEASSDLIHKRHVHMMFVQASWGQKKWDH